MSIGIGGAGSKLAAMLDPETSTIVNVSEVELDKVDAAKKMRAVIHKPTGQFRGARKSPEIGRSAFASISNEILSKIKGDIVFASTGGGTGNGLASVLLERLSDLPAIDPLDKTTFALVLPYPELEATEYVDNTINFLGGPLSLAIDAGNTGNIILYSNQVKFQQKIAEADYNDRLIDSLKRFLAIPDKGAEFGLLDGHIDFEDFSLYRSRPYFNHFTQFDFDPTVDFGEQFQANLNPLLLAPAGAIESLFLLEVPERTQTPAFYPILEHFAKEGVAPTYGVVHNPSLAKPQITISVLYSRKPLELVDDFTHISEESKRTRIKKSLEQYVTLTQLNVDMDTEARKIVKNRGEQGDDLLDTLKRLGKL